MPESTYIEVIRNALLSEKYRHSMVFLVGELLGTHGGADGAAIRDDDPAIPLEHKALYNLNGQVPQEEWIVPLGLG